MAQYWETHPCPCPSVAKSKTADVPPSLAKCGQLLKDFHCHCERLAQQDDTHEVEDWQSELWVYLRVVAKDVSPETDVVKWWQVHCVYDHCPQLPHKSRWLESCSRVSDSCSHRAWLPPGPGFISPMWATFLHNQTNSCWLACASQPGKVWTAASPQICMAWWHPWSISCKSGSRGHGWLYTIWCFILWKY